MKNEVLIVLSSLLLLSSCAGRKELKDLKEKETIYFYKNSSRPFSGKVYSLERNSRDKEFISGFYTFHQGIPKGKWKTFGYSGELFLKGDFNPITEISELQSIFPGISRINICKSNEGPYLVITLYVISRRLESDSVDFNSKKSSVFDFLNKKRLLTEKEFELIDTCEIYSSEF